MRYFFKYKKTNSVMKIAANAGIELIPSKMRTGAGVVAVCFTGDAKGNLNPSHFAGCEGHPRLPSKLVPLLLTPKELAELEQEAIAWYSRKDYLPGWKTAPAGTVT